MKTRRYTQGITIFTTPEMYRDVKTASDEQNISLAELFREMIKEYFETHPFDHQEVREADKQTPVRR